MTECEKPHKDVYMYGTIIYALYYITLLSDNHRKDLPNIKGDSGEDNHELKYASAI